MSDFWSRLSIGEQNLFTPNSHSEGEVKRQTPSPVQTVMNAQTRTQGPIESDLYLRVFTAPNGSLVKTWCIVDRDIRHHSRRNIAQQWTFIPGNTWPHEITSSQPSGRGDTISFCGTARDSTKMHCRDQRNETSPSYEVDSITFVSGNRLNLEEASRLPFQFRPSTVGDCTWSPWVLEPRTMLAASGLTIIHYRAPGQPPRASISSASG